MAEASSRYSIDTDETIRSLSFSPDGARLVGTGFQPTVVIWDAFSGELMATYTLDDQHGNLVVRWSPDGRFLATGGATIRVWDATSGTVIAAFERIPENPPDQAVFTLAWSPDSNKIAAGNLAGELFLQDLLRNELQVLGSHQGPIAHVDWAPGGEALASVGHDGVARIWPLSAAAGSPASLKLSKWLTGVTWLPDGKSVVVVGTSGNAAHWRLAEERAAVVYEQHADGITAVARAPEPHRAIFATASHDRSIRIWDLSSGSTLATYRGHHATPIGLAWSPDGEWIATSGQDHQVCVWSPWLQVQ